jgi:hypothetical protein
LGQFCKSKIHPQAGKFAKRGLQAASISKSFAAGSGINAALHYQLTPPDAASKIPPAAAPFPHRQSLPSTA